MKSQCACVRVQSASSLPDGSYRGGRKKEPPPPNMTAEQRMMWEQERDKKDKHNDSELAMTMSVCVCCYSARHPVTAISTLLHCKQTFLTTASIIFRRQVLSTVRCVEIAMVKAQQLNVWSQSHGMCSRFLVCCVRTAVHRGDMVTSSMAVLTNTSVRSLDL